jgi:tricorn protease
MIINEISGSGGDRLPWMFRQTGLGPLVGKRTWGGLVGHYTNPGDLLDGGFAGTPNLAFYTPQGTWEIENHGVPPDVEIDDDPKLARQGHSPVGESRRVGHGPAQKEPATYSAATALS